MSIVTEILHGTWMLETMDPMGYKTIANTILSGGILGEKPECYSIIGKPTINKDGKTETLDQVAVVSMLGEMTKRSGLCNLGADYVSSELLRAQNDDNIKGIIFLVDGPGGNADAIQFFKSIKSQITKPIVALIDRACSLHYWAACLLSDHLMLTSEMSEVGSIGAMIVFEKPKNELIIIRPKESSDKNQGFVDALEGKYALLEEKLSFLAQDFQASVKLSRPKIADEDLKGKTFYAKDAISRGLADSIGDMDKAYNLVLAKSEIKNLK